MKVLIVSWVPGSPMDCAIMVLSASPKEISFLELNPNHNIFDN
jgi:hypothetical protein